MGRVVGLLRSNASTIRLSEKFSCAKEMFRCENVLKYTVFDHDNAGVINNAKAALVGNETIGKEELPLTSQRRYSSKTKQVLKRYATLQ